MRNGSISIDGLKKGLLEGASWFWGETSYLRGKSAIYYDKGTGCWEYKFYLSKAGYGSKWYRGRVRKMHRITWELVNGDIPSSMVINHLCRNKKCCNPKHLESTTQADNARKGGLAKLTYTQAAEIRRAERKYGSKSELASKYNVSISTISQIRSGAIWSPENQG